jgi:hypothetical protein
MIYRQKKIMRASIVLVIVSAVLLFLSAFIEVPFNISTYSEVFPKEKWILTRGNSGQIISNHIDFTQGHSSSYNISQFERGEFISLKFSEYLKDRKEFNAGDTIANICSSDIQNQLIAQQGELEIALANLKVKNSSQKEALVLEAQNKLKYTEEKINEQKILFARTNQLFEKGYTSKQEFELQKWNLDLLGIEEKIYRAQLDNLLTGVKPEEVKLLESQVRTIEAKIDFLEKRKSDLVVTTPIKGKIISSFSPDTLLNLTNISEVVLHTPVKVADLPEFKENQDLSVYFSSTGESITGKILSIDKEVKLVNGQQVVFLSVLLKNITEKLLPGMVMENSLKLRSSSLLNQILRSVYQ